MRTSRTKPASITAKSMELIRWARWIGITVAVILVLIIPIRHLVKWRTSPPGPTPVAYQQQAPAPAVAQACPGLKEPYRFEATKPHFPVNKVGRCSSDFWYAGHCIKVQLAGSTKELGPFCHTGGKTDELPPDIEYAWSAGNPFEGAYRLGPPRYVKFLSVR